MKKDEARRKLTEDEKKYLKEKKSAFIEEGPQSYAPIAEALARRFPTLGITGILVCGGYDNDCIRLFLLNVHKKLQNLNISLSSNFVARGCGAYFFPRNMEKAGIEVSTAAGDGKALLKLSSIVQITGVCIAPIIAARKEAKNQTACCKSHKNINRFRDNYLP